MTWYLTNLFQPSGPVAAQPSPGGIGNGWSDRNGNVWSINASGYLIAPIPAGGNNAWNNSQLVRRTSLDSAVDSRVSARFIAQSGSTFGVFLYARYTESGGTSSPNGYVAGYYAGGIFSGYIASGTLTTKNYQSPLVTLTAGADYDLRVTTTQTNGTTTTVLVEMFSVASAGAALCSGTVIGSNTFTDTTAGLQNAAGYPGIFLNATGGTIKLLSTEIDTTPSTASALVVSGPAISSTGTQALNFLVESNGITSGSTSVLLSDAGAGGTFSPTSVTLPSGNYSQAAFAYTPTGAGTFSLAGTGGGLTSNNLSFTATPPPFAVPVTSAAFAFSPGNWKGDTGRGGSTYRQTWNAGAYLTFVMNASASPTATLLLPTASNSVALSYFVNGILVDNVAATGNISISGLTASTTNTIEVVFRNSPNTNTRWNNGASVLQIQGMQIDGSSTVGVASVQPAWVMIVGDSITEGLADNGGSEDSLYAYSFLAGKALQQQGYDFCVSACSGSGYICTGDASKTTGDVPAYYYVSGGAYNASKSRWNLIDQGVSLLDTNGQISAQGYISTPPAAILINYATNEYLGSFNTSDMQKSVIGTITVLRAAAPAAKILMAIPFGLQCLSAYPNTAYVAAIRNGVAGYLMANPGDTNVQLLDLGQKLANTIQNGMFINGDGIHPTSQGHAFVAPMVTAALMKSLVSGTAKSYSFS